MDQKSPSSLKNFCMFAEGKLNGTKRMIRNVVDERFRVFNFKNVRKKVCLRFFGTAAEIPAILPALSKSNITERSPFNKKRLPFIVEQSLSFTQPIFLF